MANKTIEQLGASGALAGTTLFETQVPGVTPTQKSTLTQLITLLNGSYLPLSGGTLTGALLFTDNTLDIGSNGATRPRRGYFGTEVVSPLFTGALTGAASLNVLKAGDTMTGLLTVAAAGVNFGSSVLLQDSANVLGVRNAANPQGLNVYNTFTDASNYEVGSMRWNANNFDVGSFQAGTGTPRRLRLYSEGALQLEMAGGVMYIYPIMSIGTDVRMGLDNSFDIGAAALYRPRTGYFGTSVVSALFTISTARTVATLPAAGTQGRIAYVTDALAPAFLATVVGGGAIITTVFDNGTNWVSV